MQMGNESVRNKETKTNPGSACLSFKRKLTCILNICLSRKILRMYVFFIVSQAGFHPLNFK